MADIENFPIFGHELKDAFKSVNSWVANGINWLDEVQQFYRDRSAIEKEYSTKLSALAKRYHEKKAKKSSALSVGDTPSMTPGSLERSASEGNLLTELESSATLVTWTKQLNTVESLAVEHDNYGTELINELADPLKTLGSRFEDLRKRHAEHSNKLESEMDSAYNDLRKVRSKYDSSCQEVESKRKKTESSFDFSKVKAQNAYQQQILEMHNLKNSYLIAINVTNAQKEKYYHEYIPELLNSLQDLSESRTIKLNAIWTQATQIETSMLKRSVETVNKLVPEIQKNLPTLDSRMFIEHNTAPWQEPPDVTFIPNAIWHDDNAIITDEFAIVFLRNVLSKSKMQLGELRREVDKKKREIESTKRIKQQIREGKDKRDEVEIVRSIFAQQEELQIIDHKRLAAEVETNTITALVGDVTLGSKIHNFKSQTFKIPTNCDLCGERIWGLSAKGFDCRDCGYTCHSKCEMKVPAECPGEQSKDQKKKLKAERQEAANCLINATRSLVSTDLSIEKSTNRNISEEAPTVGNNTSSPDASQKSLVKSRVVAPPPDMYFSELSASEIGMIQGTGKHSQNEKKGKMLYTYEANGEGEISVSQGSKVVILESDDGGWTMVQNLSNTESGLVPTAYIEILAPRPTSITSNSSSSFGGPKRQGPPVAPKPGAMKLRHYVALYDYTAQNSTELSIVEGERFLLVKEDPGDGWAEIEKDGRTGSVPANYIEKL
ncbi:Protein BZZ1 [Golovinomyces cichoracearum]|uniref:Protein BZZ1 n=1 Tax=Golovinomyces cichoracearum TaxID=62708 RepID=A0A420J2T3_9PEZI|nr:Protein BZZ1 [Golovinomyces cichoracearum]